MRLIGRSSLHRTVLDTLRRVAPTDAEILITGPSGVGKELYARWVHDNSSRGRAAFVPVNCGALPDTLLENELFGHVGGAFTGARPTSEGLIASAEGGTLFLDEVDTLQAVNQVKLLRFVQEKEYRRLGEVRLRRANVRVIAATNADLTEAVRTGRFREDLFFRLRVVPITVPPLRDRADDIEPLLAAYIAHYAVEYGFPPIEFSAGARARMARYGWPGNIRELQNCVRYFTCLQLQRASHAAELPLLDNGEDPHRLPTASALAELPFRTAKRDLVVSFERAYLTHALRRAGGNIAHAARASGKARRAFFELMRKHGMQAGDFAERARSAAPHPSNTSRLFAQPRDRCGT